MLDEVQKKCVFNKTGLFVSADAGVGKTYVIVEKLKYFLKNKISNLDNTIVITLTNKAADQLIDRLKKSIVNLNFKNSYISTIHSFCYKILSKQYLNFNLVDDNFLFISLKPIILRKIISLYDKDFKTILNLYDQFLKKNIYFKYKIGFIKKLNYDFLYYFYEFIENYKLKNNILTYSDLLAKVYENKNFIKNNFSFLFLDEYQDLNDFEAYVIANLGVKIFCFGDLKQAIYKFKGDFNFKILQNSVLKNNGETIELVKNYRSNDCIVELLSCIKTLYLNKFITRRLKTNENIKIVELKAFDNVSKITKSSQLLFSICQKHKLKTIGVLSKNFDFLNSVYNYFINNFNVNQDCINFNKTHTTTVNKFFYFIVICLLNYNLNSDVESKNILKFFNFSKRFRFKNVKDLMIKIILYLKTKGFNFISDQLFEYLVSNSKTADSILQEFLYSFENNLNFITSNETIFNYKNNDLNYINFMTVHQSKGLEFDVVVLLDVDGGYKILYDNIFEYNGEIIIDFNKNVNDQNSVFYKFYLDQKIKNSIYYKNLFYVASSRAKETIYYVISKSFVELENLSKFDYRWDRYLGYLLER